MVSDEVLWKQGNDFYFLSSGRSPRALTLKRAQADGFGPSNPLPRQHGHAVTVPGAAAGLADTIKEFGSGTVGLAELLQPAIKLAEEGVPICQISAEMWRRGKGNDGDVTLTDGQRLLNVEMDSK